MSRLVRYRTEKRYVTTAAEMNSCEQVYEEILQARKGALLHVLFFDVRQHGDSRDNIGFRLCLKVVHQLAKRNPYITDYISLHTDPVHIY